MTIALATALSKGKPPFSGHTLVISGLDAQNLWECYRRIQAILLEVSPTNFLTESTDWHRHDGFVTEGELLTIQKWKCWTQSPMTLHAAWMAEANVDRGVYPDDLSWYLRFLSREIVDQSDGFCIDLTGDAALIQTVAEALNISMGVLIIVTDSQEWFYQNGHTGWSLSS